MNQSATSLKSVQDAKKRLMKFLQTLDTVPTEILEQESGKILAQAKQETPFKTGKLEDSVYVRVQRENFASPLTAEQQQHRSEIALDDEVPDWLLINDGTLEDLGRKIEKICDNI